MENVSVSVISAGPCYCVTLDGMTAIKIVDERGRFTDLYENGEFVPFIEERVDRYVAKLENSTCDKSFAPPETIRENLELVVQALVNAVAYRSPGQSGGTDYI